MESLIKATLGLDTTDFQTKAKDAEKQLKGFAEGVGNIGKVFSAGGTLTAVIGFFNAVVSSARDSKNELDFNVQAVRRFGDSMDEAKAFGASMGISIVGNLNRIGELAGEATRAIFEFARGNYDVWKQQENALVKSEKALGETLKKMKEMKETHAERAGIEKQLSELRLKALTVEEQLAFHANKQADAMKKSEQTGISLVELKRAELEIATHAAKQEAAWAVLRKEAEDQTKKVLAEFEKTESKRIKGEEARAKTAELIAGYAAEEEQIRRRTFRLETQIQLAYQDLKETKRQLSTYSGEEEGKQKLITTEHTQQKALLEITAALESKRTEAAAATLGQQQSITAELKHQESAVAASKQAAYEGDTFKGPDYKTATESEIKDWLNTLKMRQEQKKSELSQNPSNQYGHVTDFVENQWSGGVERKRAEEELAKRESFKNTTKTFNFSDDVLAQQYGGYQNVEALRNAIGPQTETTKISRTLENIDNRLSQAGFRK